MVCHFFPRERRTNPLYDNVVSTKNISFSMSKLNPVDLSPFVTDSNHITNPNVCIVTHSMSHYAIMLTSVWSGYETRQPRFSNLLRSNIRFGATLARSSYIDSARGRTSVPMCAAILFVTPLSPPPPPPPCSLATSRVIEAFCCRGARG